MADKPDIEILAAPCGVPMVLTDGYGAAGVANGIVRFAFFATRPDPSKGIPIQQHVLDLAMPIGALIATHKAFGEMIADLQKNGVIQMAPNQKLDS